MKKKLTSQIYDEHIISQGLQFQIDRYYEPKETSLKRRINIILEAMNPQPQERILDIGCGVGTFAFHCAKSKTNSIGIDYSKESIKAAMILCDKYNVSKNTKFIVGNAMNLPFKDNFFDKVVATDFIEHITLEEKEKLLREIYRVLKPKGTAVIFTPNAIREKIGALYWKFRHLLFKDKIPTTDLHFGLINRFQFESLLKRYKFNFNLKYEDITRPYLARLPFLKNLLSLELLWIAQKT